MDFHDVGVPLNAQAAAVFGLFKKFAVAFPSTLEIAATTTEYDAVSS